MNLFLLPVVCSAGQWHWQSPRLPRQNHFSKTRPCQWFESIKIRNSSYILHIVLQCTICIVRDLFNTIPTKVPNKSHFRTPCPRPCALASIREACITGESHLTWALAGPRHVWSQSPGQEPLGGLCPPSPWHPPPFSETNLPLFLRDSGMVSKLLFFFHTKNEKMKIGNLIALSI